MTAIRYREALLGLRPITVRRQVVWSECDPAGFVFTARFGDFAIDAARFLTEEVIGELVDPATGRELLLPIKAASYAFERFLRPEDWFDMTIEVTELRVRTFTLSVTGRTPDGDLVFKSLLTRICYDPATGKSAAIPPAVRRRLEAYRETFAEAAGV